MLLKSPANPIVCAVPSLWWANRKVYNAAAFIKDDAYRLVFRAIGEDYISRLGMASSSDGVHFNIQELPVFKPVTKFETYGCEDPRITLIDDTYWMTYTAYDGLTARVALTSTRDFISWSERHILFPNWKEGRWVNPKQTVWNKAAAIFPEKISGKYRLFFGDDSIWEAESSDLIHWTAVKQPVLSPRDGYFDSSYIEMGPPPIRVDRGWLIIYHGISGRNDSRVYRLGAAIMDYHNPRITLWRSDLPILEPSELFEKVGKIDIIKGGMAKLRRLDDNDLQVMSQKGKLPQAVFCCGAIKEGDNIKVYYSGSDTVMCLASGSVKGITNTIKNS